MKKINSKILYILSSEFPPGPGGIGTHAHQMACQLHSRLWSVVVFSPQDYVDLSAVSDFNRKQPFSIIQLPSTWGRIYTNLLRGIIVISHAIRKRPHLILATGMRAAWLGWIISFVFRVPLVAVGHASEFQTHSFFRKKMTHSAFNWASLVIVVSQFTGNILHQYGVRPSCMRVITNGGDANRFKPRLEPELLRSKFHSLNPVLLTVGNLAERKAQDVVIQALPLVLQRFPHLLYIMVGKPTRKAELTKLAESLGVSRHVVFAGMVPTEELPLYYNFCDVFVLVSRKTSKGDVEGYGIAVIEAALCGKTAIATRGCGLAEAVVDGETGLLVEMNNPYQTAEAILTLLNNDALRTNMSKKALLRAQKGETWDTKGEEYHALLLNVLKGRKL